MFSSILVALFYTIIAGITNGSFALPTKHIKTWRFENIWLSYAIWAFLILPWLFIFLLAPSAGQVYQASSFLTLTSLLIGGFLFGIGQVCFALALNSIGLGLGFVINIGLGTGLGFLLPLLTLHNDQVFTAAGMASILGILFIFAGLLISYRAGRQRDQYRQAQQAQIKDPKHQVIQKGCYRLGILLAVLAGIFSAGQNYTFAMTEHMQTLALQMGISSLAASVIIWPPFLTCSFIPYAFYMLYLQTKHGTFLHYRTTGSLYNILLSTVMGAFWFGSLTLYSQASLLIGHLGPVVVWPLFMVLIILTSNFWGWYHHEWSDCPAYAQRNALLAVSALVIAVLALAYSAMLST